MSLSDCPKCWDTPCSCGWEYRKWTYKARIALASVVLGCDEDQLETAVEHFVPNEHPLKKSKYDEH